MIEIGISLIFYLHIFNTKYTLRCIWYDQITPCGFGRLTCFTKATPVYLDWLEDGIAELVFDAPGSVNKLIATVASLGRGHRRAGTAIRSKGGCCCVRTKQPLSSVLISPFLSLFLVLKNSSSQWLHFANSVFNRWDLPVPTIAANQRLCAGRWLPVRAGDRLSIWATPRICASSGLPETKLGIMPGFGGSVRMPRMLGADSALEIIAAGKDVGADQARKSVTVDGVGQKQKN